MSGKVIGIPPRLVNDPSCVLYLRGEGPDGSTQIRDWSQSHKTVTVNGNTRNSTTKTKFPPASIYFDGTGDYLTVPDSDDFALGSSNWTYSFWLNPQTLPTGTDNKIIYSQRVDDNNYQYIFLYGDGTIYFRNISGGTMITSFYATHGMSTGNWYQVVVERDGNTPRVYINGTSKTVTEATTISGKTLANIAATVYIGARNDGLFSYDGYMDEFAIFKKHIPIEKLYPQYRRFVV